MTEIEATVTDGYRQEPFNGEVTNFEMIESNGYSKATFEFEEGPNLGIFPPKELAPTTGEVPGYMALGILIRSLNDQNIKTILSIDDSTMELVGIRTEPDICGMTVSFDVDIRTYVKSDGEEGKNYDWRVTKAESSSTPAPKPKSKDTPAKEPKPEPESNSSEQSTLWEEIILDVLSNGSMSEGGIMKAMKIKVPDKAEQKKMNDVRRSTIETMALDGIIKKEGNEYQLV